MSKVTFLESLEIEINENHGVVYGSACAIDLDGVIKHNAELYDHMATLNEPQIKTQLENQKGRLFAWWRSGLLTDSQHNEMLTEVRTKAIKITNSLA
ncbi:hypothetical protein [Vibrio sp. 1180_3]|uniref:hypothetical protein n=1 Tax=Vibrio sp. 1180_3 TaxID=2528832 RepID=UPI002405A4CA|nr:hypothetical protein [Vibrio sp. 1180_3]MDF9399212.1 hypothetical protein [Vibrio sp. 1180_3]